MSRFFLHPSKVARNNTHLPPTELVTAGRNGIDSIKSSVHAKRSPSSCFGFQVAKWSRVAHGGRRGVDFFYPPKKFAERDACDTEHCRGATPNRPISRLSEPSTLLKLQYENRNRPFGTNLRRTDPLSSENTIAG